MDKNRFGWAIVKNASSARSVSLLDPYHKRLLVAGFGEGQRAKNAFIEWRNNLVLDDIDRSALRIISQLVDTAKHHGIREKEFPRLRGITKHTWLTNQFRTQALCLALDILREHDIPCMLLKGGALFARYSALASLREAGDYDLLVQRRDAERVILLFSNLGLRSEGLRAEKYAKRDFDQTHGVHFTAKDRIGTVDLHWQPLPFLSDENLVDELFARAEPSVFAGRQVKIPSIADQLFLAIARIELWDIPEQFTRVVEATHLLQYSKGSLNWNQFIRLTERHDTAPIAAAVFSVLRHELGIEVPLAVKCRVEKTRLAFWQTEMKLKSIPPYERTQKQQRVMDTLAIFRKRPRRFQWLSRPRATVNFVTTLVASIRSVVTGRNPVSKVWRKYAGQTHQCGPNGPDYLFGFSLPEDMGRWTDGIHSVFTMPVVAKIGTSVRLKMSVIPTEPSGGSPVFRFKVCAGLGEVSSIVLRRPHQFKPVEIVISAEVIDQKYPRALVALELTDANAPILSKRTSDTRILGLMFCNVEVIP